MVNICPLGLGVKRHWEGDAYEFLVALAERGRDMRAVAVTRNPVRRPRRDHRPLALVEATAVEMAAPIRAASARGPKPSS
jgi:hypothetical protein